MVHDLVLVGPTRPGPALARRRWRAVHSGLAHLIPPPSIGARLPFRFPGLVRDGRIVALCDTTVDDEQVVAITQVHTVGALRRQGLGTEPVRGVLAFAHALGRRTAVWVCDRENLASVALAERGGLSVALEVPRPSPR